jgi:Uma2 family endonuclease
MSAQARGDSAAAGGQPRTADELARMPRDGDRHELLDGQLVISARPSPLHQVVAARLSGMLAGSCPEGMGVLPGPAIRLSRSTVLTADLTVMRRQPPDDSPLTGPPLLVAEIRAPGPAPAVADRRAAAYAAFGVWSYWLLVLDVRWPELTVFELADGRYERVARAVGGEVFRARQPFFTEIIPARLTAGLLPADRPRDTIGVTA